MNKKNVLAIIPARGGSKRIPRKNIRTFIDRPIIAYSIQAAQQSLCFDEIMVSTEDYEIADIAQSLGAKVPFMRSAQAADDMTMLMDVVEEVLVTYKAQGKIFDELCCILPTAPFITPDLLLKGYQLLRSSRAGSVIPVAKFSYPIQRSLVVRDGRLSMFWPENYNRRSQDLEIAYHDGGMFYWMNVGRLHEEKRLFFQHPVPLEIPETASQDIDVEEDWKIAELKYQALKKAISNNS